MAKDTIIVQDKNYRITLSEAVRSAENIQVGDIIEIDVKKIKTVGEIDKSIAEKGKGKEEEEVPRFKAVQFEYGSISPENARRFFSDYRKYLPAILVSGIGAWLEAHREAYTFPITTHNVQSLSTALKDGMKVQDKQWTLREIIAAEFVSDYAWAIVEYGLAFAAEQFNWQMKYDYYKDTLKRKDLPDLTTFKKDALDTISSGAIFIFD